MPHAGDLDYLALAGSEDLVGAGWAEFVSSVLVAAWIETYAEATTWQPHLLEVDQGKLTYLFDAAPTLDGLDRGDDRVVAVWGTSQAPAGKRDRSRMAGFLPLARLWSGRGRDRGHLVAHGAGGGLDLNLLPQAATLNRGHSADGKRWREIERLAAAEPGTPLFVRPLYHDLSWTPVGFDYGVVLDKSLRVERFRDEVG
jgi:hypothetical protein